VEKDMSKEYSVAIVGATGAVGEAMRLILEQRDFPTRELRLLASHRSEGKLLPFRGEELRVEVLGEDSFAGVEVALFSAGAARSQEFAPHAVRAGALVVDNSSAFRMDESVPLVVPEVNPGEVFKHQGIIANPNCSTIQMVVALKPLHDRWGLTRVIVSTYQAVSGTGRNAILELDEQVRDLEAGREPRVEVYAHQIAFNCLPHIDVFMEGGYTREEWKMVRETQKIMGLPGLPVTATTVRVPVRTGHSESVYAEFAAEVSVQEARELLGAAPGIVVEDDPETNLYPLAIRAAGTDPCFVGRIRKDLYHSSALNFWVVADNLRKGAALNAVQIAEIWAAGPDKGGSHPG
jgi:aspartate-semialdehyde dehydrogenase